MSMSKEEKKLAAEEYLRNLPEDPARLTNAIEDFARIRETYERRAKWILEDPLLISQIVRDSVREAAPYTDVRIKNYAYGSFEKSGDYGVQMQNGIPVRWNGYFEALVDFRFPRRKKPIRVFIGLKSYRELMQGYPMEVYAMQQCIRMAVAEQAIGSPDFQGAETYYFIWVCPDAPGSLANTITEYSVSGKSKKAEDDKVLGGKNVKTILVSVNGDAPTDVPLLRTLGIMFSLDTSAEEKKQAFRQNGLRLGREIGSDLTSMYELSTLMRQIRDMEGMTEFCTLLSALERDGRYADMEAACADIEKRKELMKQYGIPYSARKETEEKTE